MRTNRLYLVIGALAVIVVGLAVYIWREQSQPDGVEIRIDEGGISVEEN